MRSWLLDCKALLEQGNLHGGTSRSGELLFQRQRILRTVGRLFPRESGILPCDGQMRLRRHRSAGTLSGVGNRWQQAGQSDETQLRAMKVCFD